MEAAGLGIGAVSLLALFKTCLEMYDTIECGRRYGADYEVLTTKVGIERVRLVLWGDSVGLNLGAEDSQATTGPTFDPRLSDARMVKAVWDVLCCMRELFENTSSMTRRYGLQSAQAAQNSIAGTNNALMTTFRRTYSRFQRVAVQAQRGTTEIAITARWAIKDKKRFERFIEDLRGFNDSLCALFPDLNQQVQQQIVTEIKASTNLGNLQIVEQAVIDMEAGEELADAASVRITELSKRSTSVADDDADSDVDLETISEAVEAMDNKSSVIMTGGVNLKRLTKQLEKLEIALRANTHGALQLSIWHSWGGLHQAFFTWEDVQTDEYYAQKDRETEYVRHPYTAWGLMYAPDKQPDGPANWADHDSEAGRKYEGRYPGTRTVEGYAANFSEWSRLNEKHDAERIWSTRENIPKHTMAFLVEQLRRLQLQRSLPWDERRSKEIIDTLLGLGADSAAGSGIWWGPLRISEILSTLNRTDMFDDVRGGGSLAAIAMAPRDPPDGPGLANFLFQMVLAYELKLRIPRAGDVGFGNYGARIVATVMAAERWIDGVLIKLTDPKKTYIEMHSLVHERQVEGLVRFAELMAWPALGEMRSFVEDAYANVRAGANISHHLWDWLFGTMLPGNAFVFTIMSALVDASPSLMKLGAPRFYASGLVLDDRSYWRASFVLGRVLGGLKGVRAANGWVGPCPLPVRESNTTVTIPIGWWRVQARDVGFKLPKHLPSHADADEDAFFSNLNRVAEGSSKADWVRTIGDQSKWIVPVGPSGSSDVVEFRAVRFKSLPIATNLGAASGDGDSFEQAPGETEKITTENTEEQMQRASIDLAINGASICFTIYNNPVFVAVPRCIDGPHAIHERDIPKLQHIKRVSQLPGYIHNDKRVLVIDATGVGECELAARAWCAEYGQHAIIRRRTGACFACSVRAASPQGLDVGCLIWA